MKNKTNIIKSFIKAGIFPLNPANINRSRLLQNEEKPTSGAATTNTSSRTTTNEPADSTNVAPLLTVSPVINNTNLIVSIQQPSSSISSTFNSSQEAIAMLNLILKDTLPTFDDEDDGCVLSHGAPESADSVPAPKVRQHRSKTQTNNLHCQAPTPRRSRRKYPIRSAIIGIESSDGEG
jgi:hypothetical protein